MQFATLIFGAGSVGPFASRAFVPAFITAMMMRFTPEYVSWMSDDMAGVAADAPGWFTSDISLLIFGVLAALEIAATKSPDLRAVFREVDAYIKPIVAMITYMGVTSIQGIELVPEAIQQAGFADSLPALMIGLGVYWMGTLRSGAMGLLIDADEEDAVGVQGLFSWAEDVWAIFGPVLLLVFPIVMLVLMGVVAWVLVLIRKRAEAKDEQSKIACASCGEMIYSSAVRCFACESPVASPCAISFLGRSLAEPAGDLRAHPYRLVEKKRCPVCASRFEKRDVHQRCTACGHELFSDDDFAEAYLARSAVRLPVVLAVSALFSLIPVVGLIPGVIYYRITLIAPMRRYIPPTRAIVLRWGIRILLFFLIMFQWVPVAGGLVVPIMALVNYTVYRAAFKGLLNHEA